MIHSSSEKFPEFAGTSYGNVEMYVDILHRLRDVVRRKRREKWRTNSSLLLHDNAPAHRSVLGNDFLSENNVATLKHPIYSPVWIWFLPALKGRRFCDATDIIRNATDELKRFSQNDSRKCFQHFYTRRQKCMAVQGDYRRTTVSAVDRGAKKKWKIKEINLALLSY